MNGAQKWQKNLFDWKGKTGKSSSRRRTSPEVMAQSFSNQILSIMYILKNHKKMANKVIKVPDEIDIQIAKDALKAMNVKIDKLTKNKSNT